MGSEQCRGWGQGEPNGQKRGGRSPRRKTAHRPATARCATPAFPQGASHPVQQMGGSLLAAKAPRVGFTPRQGLLATGRQHDRIPGGRQEHKSGLTQEGRNQLGLDEPGWSQTWIPKAGMQRGPCGIQARRRQGRGPSRETQAISAQEQGTSCLVSGSSPHGSCHIPVSRPSPRLWHLPYPDPTSPSFQAVGWSPKSTLTPQWLLCPHPVFSTTSAPGSLKASCLDAKFLGPPPKQDGNRPRCLCRGVSNPVLTRQGVPWPPLLRREPTSGGSYPLPPVPPQ